MCDCAEALRGKKKPPGRTNGGTSDSNGGYSARTVMALSALSAVLFGYMLYTLDRRTIKKILTVFGLGWLVACPCESKVKRPCCSPPPPCSPPPCPPPPCPPPPCPPPPPRCPPPPCPPPPCPPPPCPPPKPKCPPPPPPPCSCKTCPNK